MTLGTEPYTVDFEPTVIVSALNQSGEKFLSAEETMPVDVTGVRDNQGHPITVATLVNPADTTPNYWDDEQQEWIEGETVFYYPTLRYRTVGSQSWNTAAAESWLKVDLGVLLAGEYEAQIGFTAPEGTADFPMSSQIGNTCLFTVGDGAKNRVILTASLIGRDRVSLTASGQEGAALTVTLSDPRGKSTVVTTVLPRSGVWTGEVALTGGGEYTVRAVAVLNGEQAQDSAAFTRTSRAPDGLTMEAAPVGYRADRLFVAAPEDADRLLLYRGNELVAVLSGNATEYTDQGLPPMWSRPTRSGSSPGTRLPGRSRQRRPRLTGILSRPLHPEALPPDSTTPMTWWS